MKPDVMGIILQLWASRVIHLYGEEACANMWPNFTNKVFSKLIHDDNNSR